MLSYPVVAYQYYRDKIAQRRPQRALPRVESIDPPARWFHSIDLGDGDLTRGTNPKF
jgi:hypothetical protein